MVKYIYIATKAAKDAARNNFESLNVSKSIQLSKRRKMARVKEFNLIKRLFSLLHVETNHRIFFLITISFYKGLCCVLSTVAFLKAFIHLLSVMPQDPHFHSKFQFVLSLIPGDP